MGAWGKLAFDNDTACDWAFGLDDVDDLSLVESAFDELEAVGAGYLDQGLACNALAACEVLARLRGNPGYRNAYTKSVDDWVKAHPTEPTPALLDRASAAIDRVLGDESELRALWEDARSGDDWRVTVEDLRRRLRASPDDGHPLLWER